MSKKIGSAIIFGDNHFPYSCQESHDAIYEFAKYKQPDSHVHIGDCLDLGGISRHVKDDLIAQVDDLVETGLISLGKHFNKLMEKTPKSKIYWIEGNHDQRLDAFVKKNPSWRKILDNPLKLLRAFGDCDTSKIEYVRLDDFEDDFRLGKMHFCHGFYTGKHTAATHADAYKENITFGHCHTVQMFTNVHRSKPYAGYAIGHLMSKEGRKYLKGRPTRWVKGFAYYEYIKPNGIFTMHLLPIVNGQFIFDGRIYGK